MKTARTIQSDLAYFKDLVGAGWEGISSARHDVKGGVFEPPLLASAWKPTVVGAALGVLAARLAVKRGAASTLAFAGAVGSVIGFGTAAAWASRGFTSSAARNVGRHVTAARDARWLQLNPIDYA